jgi:hypothetical protein
MPSPAKVCQVVATVIGDDPMATTEMQSLRGDDRSYPLPLTRFLHENMAIVMTFVFSQAPMKRMINERFKGYWEYLEDFAFEVPRRNAIRACLEIALLIRLVDDTYKTPPFMKKRHLFGAIYSTDGKTKPLYLREFTNKIIHAKDLSWDLSDENAPKLWCTAPEEQRIRHKWERAEVNIISLAAYCGVLASSAGRL